MQNKKTPERGSAAKQDKQLGPGQSTAVLGRDIQAKIGEQLRALYDDVVDQGVPDRFADLLKQLDKPEGGDRA